MLLCSSYAFDVSQHHSSPFLINRRLFAFTEAGVPRSIKCDDAGNVYAGCEDGLNVWSPGGVLLGKFGIPNGVTDFCFGKKGEILLLNGHHLVVLTVNKDVKGPAVASSPQCTCAT